MTAPELHTRRLLLRGFGDEDVRPLFERFFSVPGAVKYTGETLHESDYDTFLWLKRAITSDDRIVWGFERENDGLVGFGGLEREKGPGTWELAYYIFADDWGRGIAAEASERIAEYAGDVLHADRLTAKCSVENAASAKVLQKLGFTFCGETTITKLDGGGMLDAFLYEKRL